MATTRTEVTGEQLAQPAGRTPRTPPPKPLPRGSGYALKRTILGPALPTTHLVHERLGKPTALAVFASDNLSSVAYATEEILKVGVPVAGLAAFAMVMPVTFAILGVLAILLFSYRQTIKAYPSAGGAYIVTRDNFGLLIAQIAGVALLTDYVLTVSVSVAAGIAAVTSAFAGLYPYRVALSVFCIWFIAWGNLRGVRESGRMFAVPTYFFIFMMFTLLAVGLYEAATGALHPLPVPPDAAVGAGAISLFLIFHAFASGGAAVTGVEAISNGVPAFKPPEWRNARRTLMWMGSLLGVMFLGLSFLATKLQVVPSETQTVISQVGRAVFGSGAAGYALFLMLQIATTLILILAANTSFADFPRLANFHATDNFMPRQLTKRGHRLVFSNGIVGLAVAATVLVVLFQADVHKLIPLYAIGVFTSFTLSQAGMARRHVRVKEPGWRHGLAINGLGAITTGAVTVIIAYTKFGHGAWAVMVFVPIMVLLLVRMNRQYEREYKELDQDIPRFDSSAVRRPIVVVVVEDVDRKTAHALQYAKTLRAAQVQAVHLEPEKGNAEELERRWRALGIDVPLQVVRYDGDAGSALAGYVGGLPPATDVNVIIPGPAHVGPLERLRRGRVTSHLTRALLPSERARVTLVHDHAGTGHVATETTDGHTRLRVVPRPHHRVIIPVDKPDLAVLRAARYALSLGATEVRAVHAAVDTEHQEQLIAKWMALGLPIELDVIECWDRNVARALEMYVVDQMGKDSEVTVVMPRREYARRRQRLLHDRTSRKIARALGRYEHVDLAAVPYYFGKHQHREAGVG
jgi:amino acid transporter